jgi:hypothetical protein
MFISGAFLKRVALLGANYGETIQNDETAIRRNRDAFPESDATTDMFPP